MHDSSPVRLIFVCACVAGLSAASAGAQAPRPSTPRCDTVLTRAEALAIVGAEFKGPAFKQPRPDFTTCDWEGPDANFGFTFAGIRALKADKTTAAETFESDLVAVEDDQRKREPLTDIGLKAARVSLGDDAFLVEVQRADGVARMIFYKIAEDKILALARAVALP